MHVNSSTSPPPQSVALLGRCHHFAHFDDHYSEQRPPSDVASASVGGTAVDARLFAGHREVGVG